MAKKLFTYKVACSFEMQFTFNDSEVEQSDEGNEGSGASRSTHGTAASCATS